MKLKFPVVMQQTSEPRKASRGLPDCRPDTSHLTPRTERGIALIVTLIMLSVITFLTVAFLVLSQRERGSVTTSTEQLISKQASDSALERAKVELLTPMLSLQNDQVYGMIVSTNYINRAGFNTANIPAPDRYTNVNFDYQLNGNPLNNQTLQLQNLANLLYNPRPPVFMTNRTAGVNEFRYYLDLNRNGRYDTNGFQPLINPNGGFYDTNGNFIASPILGNTMSNFFVGDPEWIGVLERPEQPHSSSNKFIARYAYIVVPSGQTLDVNYIHNQAASRDLNPGTDGFFRNQGAGSWEINLAAFLVDLNTNIWSLPANAYQYYRWNGVRNDGIAFNDALSLLSYRYNYSYNNLATVNGLFGTRGGNAFQNDFIDGYSDGPLMSGTLNTVDDDTSGTSWAGSDNPNHFFSTQEFFDPTKTPIAFINRLRQGGTNVSSYDRYTYYRMLEQLGTDTAPAPAKMNINYVNVDGAGNVMPDAETNFISWNAGQFFTNAANRIMLRFSENWIRENFVSFTNMFGTDAAFGITNIPVFYSYRTTNSVITNIFCYTPSIHRALQMAANIYDATTNRTDLNTTAPYFPHVYRPIFRRDNNDNVYIVGYRELENANATILNVLQSPNQIDLSLKTSAVNSRDKLPLLGTPFQNDANEPMVAGIPLVIGAKKGFPNFNKFALANAITVSRDLQFHRDSPSLPMYTNQCYYFALSNSFGMQIWNSYSNSYPRPLGLYAVADVSLSMTNETPGEITRSNRYLATVTSATNFTIAANSWTGFLNVPGDNRSFRVPVFTNSLFLPVTDYIQDSDRHGRFSLRSEGEWDPINTFRVPQLSVNVRTRIRMTLVDLSENRIVDYVSLDSTADPLNLIDAARRTGDTVFVESGDPDPGSLWATNRPNNGGTVATSIATPTMGVIEQIKIASGAETVSRTFWNSYNNTGVSFDAIKAETDRFKGALFVTKNVRTNFSSPFNPTRKFFQYVRWEANDPLVHYTVPDLMDVLTSTERVEWDTDTKNPVKRLSSINPLSDHYRPWNGNPNNTAETSVPTKLNPEVKDPLVFKSDDWNFPTNKLPSVGWLGRVHRGTPWQTVYMKATDNVKDGNIQEAAAWSAWWGNTNAGFADAYYARPVMDRELFDLFSTTINENGQRGQLPINQTNLAAWSAVLSGVAVLTNDPVAKTFGYTNIQPAAISTEVADIVGGIVATKTATFTNGNKQVFNRFPNKYFSRLGDILAVPELTENSPFLITNGLRSVKADGISDEVLERIPQQIMSLLTLSHSPRFVVYSYGQSLKPAPNSVVTAGGQFFQMCTNYQVTAETATRSVVRVEGSFNPADTNLWLEPLRRYPPRIVVEQFNVLPPD